VICFVKYQVTFVYQAIWRHESMAAEASKRATNGPPGHDVRVCTPATATSGPRIFTLPAHRTKHFNENVKMCKVSKEDSRDSQ